MKIKLLSITLILAIFICALLPSCSEAPKDSAPAITTHKESSYDVIIRELEEKILELQQNQYISEAESEKKIKELQDKIDALRAQYTTAPSSSSATLPDSVFTYTVSNGKAIISGFTGKDTHLVIPSQIDGFDVIGIAENAFEGYSLKSVIISNGVQFIDWFAFYNCTALSSITIPSSVTRIGHSAFDGASQSFTIYCGNDSFAHKYAQSYGIAYTVI
ncbi:MAG: leucine-rich repeat protein [Clostridia bacterium]|nr:leucine-rich repeat protein [Clostridia bacterium]